MGPVGGETKKEERDGDRRLTVGLFLHAKNRRRPPVAPRGAGFGLGTPGTSFV